MGTNELSTGELHILWVWVEVNEKRTNISTKAENPVERVVFSGHGRSFE